MQIINVLDELDSGKILHRHQDHVDPGAIAGQGQHQAALASGPVIEHLVAQVMEGGRRREDLAGALDGEVPELWLRVISDKPPGQVKPGPGHNIGAAQPVAKPQRVAQHIHQQKIAEDKAQQSGVQLGAPAPILPKLVKPPQIGINQRQGRFGHHRAMCLAAYGPKG